MSEHDHPSTELEDKIGAFLRKEHVPYINPLTQQLQDLCQGWMSQGIPPYILVTALTTNLAALMSASKIAGTVPEPLINLLIDDIAETVRKRSFRGVPFLHTPPRGKTP